jgi:hypothetical protein
MKTYLLVQGGTAILCLRCGHRSYHPDDINQRYCGYCHQFHIEIGKEAIPAHPQPTRQT